MKILLSYKATVGQGGQGLNFKHVLEAIQDNCETVVFSETPEIGFKVPSSFLGNTLGKIPVVRKRRDFFGLWEQFHFDKWVSKRIPSADFVIAGAGHALETFKVAKKNQSRCILDVTTLHVDQFGECQDVEIKKFGGRTTLHSVVRKRIREEYKIADRIRVMSQVAKKSLLERGVDEGKIFVAIPPIYNPNAPSKDLRDDSFRIVFVGLLEPAKGFHYLIEAFRGLEGDCCLDLYGGPGLRGVARYLEGEIKTDPRIQMIPKSVQGNFEEVYCRASVLVLPSLSDGFGYVAGEAMACGVPVIVTTACGAADLIEEGISGFVVPPGDSIALRNVLETCRRNPIERNRIGKAGLTKTTFYTSETFRKAWELGIR